MVTMKEVADLAGVSTATVSHVVNGTKRLSPETTERVRMAIRQANYTPNTLAKSLRSGQTHTIGVLVEDIRVLPVAEIVSSISETLARGGYRMLMFDLHLLEKLYNQYEQIVAYRDHINAGAAALIQAHVDGIIYVGMHDRHLDPLFNPMRQPLVFAHSHGTQLDSCVTYANLDSAKALTQYLIGKGHRRIAVIAGQPHSYPTVMRLKGYKQAMSEAGLPVPTEYICYGDWESDSGRVRTLELLACPKRPSAIFAMNDLMAAGCIHTLVEAGLSVPRDVAVAGFDNREVARCLNPPLTTVALPTAEIGMRAARRILSLIQNPDAPPQREIVECSIIERESV